MGNSRPWSVTVLVMVTVFMLMEASHDIPVIRLVHQEIDNSKNRAANFSKKHLRTRQRADCVHVYSSKSGVEFQKR